MAGDKAGRVIFIGNIPYGLTEEQIVHIFSNVGQVLSFRLVYDKDTGRPKGFGFAEFSDADSAASAVRNLNDYEVMNRRLRVDYSNDGNTNDSGPQHQHQQNQNQQHQQPPMQPPLNPIMNGPGIGMDSAGAIAVAGANSSSALPPLPAGADLPPNLTCPDAISRTLSALPAPQLIDIISQMKGLVMSDPGKASQLLSAAPQLSYAIFQSLLLLGLVDTSALASVVDQTSMAPNQPPQSQLPQQMQTQQQQYPYVPTPPKNPNQGYAPPPPPPPPPPPAAAVAVQQQQPNQLAQLHQQVLALTQQQLDAMPPMERAQLMAIRQQIIAGQYPGSQI